MTDNCSVYGLISTEHGVVRYVGQTIQPLKRRLIQHIAEAKRGKGRSRCHRWIRKALRNGYEIRIVLLEANAQWNESEIIWISAFRNPRLTNITLGGDGYRGKRSKLTRLRMSKPKSEAHRAKIRAATQAPRSIETRQKMSMAQMGNHKSRGESNRHAHLTETDVVDIKRALNKGHGVSELAHKYAVQKAAISKIKRGRTWSYVKVA